MSASTAAQLYIWYRVPAAAVAAAIADAAAMQVRLRARFALLEPSLLRRPGDDGGMVTLMEIYRHPGGIDAELEAAIAEAASALAAPRQVERFVPAER